MFGNASSSSPGEHFSYRERPGIITISGANKDIGKSSLAAFIIRHCRSCAGVKVTVHAERPPGEAVMVEEDPPLAPGTDTARMVEAGASPVFWVRTTVDDMAADLAEVWTRLDAPIVVVEGNSVLDHVEPDYAVFIMGSTLDDFKPSAWSAIKKAHTVVVNGEQDIPGADILRLEREIKKMNPKAKMVVVSELGRDEAWGIVLSRILGRTGGGSMSDEVEEKVLEAVKDRADEGRIACAVALRLAEELKVPAAEVGKAANALNVKIVKCSLGCF